MDHINRIKTDNRLDNLREVSQSVNMHNIGNHSNNTSGYKGVFKSYGGKYKSQIYVNKKCIYLGTFDTAELASEAYNKYYNELNI